MMIKGVESKQGGEKSYSMSTVVTGEPMKCAIWDCAVDDNLIIVTEREWRSRVSIPVPLAC
jgi:hypothetical protein